MPLPLPRAPQVRNEQMPIEATGAAVDDEDQSTESESDNTESEGDKTAPAGAAQIVVEAEEQQPAAPVPSIGNVGIAIPAPYANEVKGAYEAMRINVSQIVDAASETPGAGAGSEPIDGME